MNSLPLFPLHAVLFPEGVLPLRVFEARYMDMVRDCMQRDVPFGVCLITAGAEVGSVARTEAVGCLARIVAWEMQQLGLLHIRAVGGQRFRVRSTRVQPNQLLLADVDLIAPDADCAIDAEHEPCAQLLAGVIDDLRAQLEQKRRAGLTEGNVLGRLPFEEPFRLDSSVWVGNRLCEILPVPLKAKQKLMELEDARARLQIITQYLRQHAVLK
ncbi:MAG: LON peptidase substrate-binding domain-containing protein [Sutterellaceae bacterium]|nr:LON peptidase substrate-binding domain-containing protein [Burkholderiaceae bacterium]MCX7902615.1 LON peptidase substrate-binding domain-containing protein [Burkholderiaceae bacterium]MDW8430260.1 LON peptidase substrate-binding domain-containing protein [Sutterellaceae bacterium]